MRSLVKELMEEKITRRGFLAGMVAAGYSAASAQSALQSVAPFTASAQAPPQLTRVAQGTGGELMVDQILETGARYLFVSNGSGLGPICDALVSRPQLQLIQATHEGQVVAIADGYAKASGKAGFCMYSRVGLPHSTSNMYNASKDRTPLVILADHAEVMREGTDSHEDIDDWMEAIKQYTKWRWVCHQPERIPEWIRQAYKVATVLPGGPTAVRIPRDLLYKETRATIFKGGSFSIPMELRPDKSEVERVARMLIEASSPMLYVGPEVSQCKAQKSLVQLAELLALPVTTHRSFYCDFPNFHPLFLGELSSRMRYPERIDLLLNFGARPASAGATRNARIIHASVDPETIGRNTPLSAALVGDLNQVAQALTDAVQSMISRQELAKRTEQRRAECAAYTAKMRAARFAAARRSSGSPIPWQRLMVEFADLLDKDAVIVEEVGTEAKILSFFSFSEDGGMLKIGRTEGRALGWGVGASAGVKLALPNRQVVSFQGDGGFMFGQTDSLWTMSRYDIPVLTVILNNLSYEETRWNIMGEMGPAGRNNRDYISYLGDPDIQYPKLAEAHGFKGETVHDSEELRPAIQRALKTLRDGRPYLLDVRTETFGIGAELTWYQKFSLAQTRERQV